MKLKISLPGKLRPKRKAKSITTQDQQPDGLRWFWSEYKYAVIILLIALVIILRSVISYGQESRRKPINTGGQAPDITINNILNDPGQSVKLCRPGKLLILDFWDTWCSACVRELPRLDSLQTIFKDEVLFLPVTDQKAELIRHFLKTNGYLAPYPIISVTDDKMLGRLFPHNQLPHEVWIGPAGKVLAITTAQYVNAANIRKVLKGGQADWISKTDATPIDLSQPSLAASLLNRVRDGQPVYTECLTGYLQGLPLKAGVVRQEATNSYYFINHSLLHLYTLALNSPLPITANRRILKVDHPGDLEYSPGQGYLNVWQSLHCYSYEATVPSYISKAAVMQQLKCKLDSWLRLEGNIRPVLTDCLVLRARDAISGTGESIQPDSASRKRGPLSLREITSKSLTYFLNRQAGMPPVIDESGSQAVFNLNTSDIPRDIQQWNEVLGPAGLELRQEKRMLDMFVLEKPETPAVHQHNP